MAYEDDEASVADGDVTELFDFTGPTASYRYTSGPTAVTYGGNSYAPAPGLVRAPVGTSSTRDAPSISLSMRVTESVIQTFGGGAPPRSLRLRIYRTQANSGEARTIWDGVVVGIVSRGEMAEVRSTSLVGLRLATQLPSLAVQQRCQHFLYDERCGVDRATYEHSTTVSSLSGSEVTVASVGGASDDYYGTGGEIERVADGERRAVYKQRGAVLTLASPFVTLAPGDAVKMWPGCNHMHLVRNVGGPAPIQAEGDCLTKFDNVANYGGHPTVPGANPFTSSVRTGRWV